MENEKIEGPKRKRKRDPHYITPEERKRLRFYLKEFYARMFQALPTESYTVFDFVRFFKDNGGHILPG